MITHQTIIFTLRTRMNIVMYIHIMPTLTMIITTTNISPIVSHLRLDCDLTINVLAPRPWIERLLSQPLNSVEFLTAANDRFCDLLNFNIHNLSQHKKLRRKIISWKVTNVCDRMDTFIARLFSGIKLQSNCTSDVNSPPAFYNIT